MDSGEMGKIEKHGKGQEAYQHRVTLSATGTLQRVVPLSLGFF